MCLLRDVLCANHFFLLYSLPISSGGYCYYCCYCSSKVEGRAAKVARARDSLARARDSLGKEKGSAVLLMSMLKLKRRSRSPARASVSYRCSTVEASMVEASMAEVAMVAFTATAPGCMAAPTMASTPKRTLRVLKMQKRLRTANKEQTTTTVAGAAAAAAAPFVEHSHVLCTLHWRY